MTFKLPGFNTSKSNVLSNTESPSSPGARANLYFRNVYAKTIRISINATCFPMQLYLPWYRQSVLREVFSTKMKTLTKRERNISTLVDDHIRRFRPPFWNKIEGFFEISFVYQKLIICCVKGQGNCTSTEGIEWDVDIHSSWNVGIANHKTFRWRHALQGCCSW